MMKYGAVFIALVFAFDIFFFTFASNGSLKDSLEWDTERSKLVIYVSASSGTDLKDCGSKDRPCKSISYGLHKAMQSNVSSTVIKVLPGLYQPEAVRIDCSNSILQSFIIQGLGKNVSIGLSTDIIKCDASFINVHWTNSQSQSVLINLIISNFSLVNSTISHVGFSLLSSGSIIKMLNSIVTNCMAWQPLLPLIFSTGLTGFDSKLSLKMSMFSYNKAPLLSAKGIIASILQHCDFIFNDVSDGSALINLDDTPTLVTSSNFTRNVGTNIKMSGGSSVNITQTVFKSNNVLDGTLLDVGRRVTLKTTGCSFIQSYGVSDGPVTWVNQGVSNVTFVSCQFSCNQVNESIHMPPIKNFAKGRHMNCTNCTLDQNCPVFCGRGEYLVDSVMCLQCPSGSYNPAMQYNITVFSCKRCKPGYYNPNTGRDSCMPCKEGSFAAKSGSTMCSLCKNDFMTSSRGQASCSKWTIGFTVLTVCVILLILLPLVLLLIQYLQTRKHWTTTKQTNFTRLYDTSIQN